MKASIRAGPAQATEPTISRNVSNTVSKKNSNTAKKQNANLNQDLTLHMLAASLGTNQEIKEGLALGRTNRGNVAAERSRTLMQTRDTNAIIQ
jgi:hypothetical protein